MFKNARNFGRSRKVRGVQELEGQLEPKEHAMNAQLVETWERFLLLNGPRTVEVPERRCHSMLMRKVHFINS
jgi:hypothetical protein